ncbi:MAG TPA: anthranilate synthase component I family protein [Bacteroidales bacterium]|nr:anthranilate synthase component I family protein [Bacteroidales bacterium]
MKKYIIKTSTRKLLADTITPVSIYLRIRDVFPNSLLLESSDYHGNENSYSFICLKPLAGFEVNEGIATEHYPDGSSLETKISSTVVFKDTFRRFMNSFQQQKDLDGVPVNGLFGYTSYDAIKYFENINIRDRVIPAQKIPHMKYHFYNYIIAINHFQNVLHIIENRINGEPNELERIETLLNSRNLAIYDFRPVGSEQANITDEQYKSMVSKGKTHCHRGDVFQVVLSRQYSQQFLGDEFNVYRALRSINPSPYLFYFDYGSYKIFGSSPEAHLKINKGTAYINPIAGTFRRTGDDENDKLLAQQLTGDLKENAEHVMLVDLARNDLSRHAENVTVEKYREVQFFSHVIHLVSAVSGKLNDRSDITDMMTATFPAGTLTGAPKFRAMQLIDEYENQSRGYYGGAIGFLDFNGRFNHAIMIRTFLSKGNTLYYQAGAGIVAISDEENELQEVNNKLGALKKAIEMATTIK